MLLDAMGIILADNHRIKLGELVNERALAAVPFGGRYRIIDTMLSSMVNSGIKHIGVLAETKYSSLMDHIGTGSYWDLDRLQQGLRIIPPYTQSDFFRTPNPQDLTGLYDFLKHSVQQYVIIAESNNVANMDFTNLVNAHVENQSDVTIMYNEDGAKFGLPWINLTFEDNLVTDVLIDAEHVENNNSSLGICIMERNLLMDMVSQSIARNETLFNVEYILKKHKELTIKGFKYEEFILRINSLATYFSASMKLLNVKILQHIYKNENKVFTKVKNEAPAKYDKNNTVSNSLISDGCEIRGEVKNSIIFRGVGIARHAKVNNCILMQDSQVMEGAELTNVIIDKDTIVRAGVRLHGSPDYPVVIGKGVIV